MFGLLTECGVVCGFPFQWNVAYFCFSFILIFFFFFLSCGILGIPRAGQLDFCDMTWEISALLVCFCIELESKKVSFLSVL